MNAAGHTRRMYGVLQITARHRGWFLKLHAAKAARGNHAHSH